MGGGGGGIRVCGTHPDPCRTLESQMNRKTKGQHSHSLFCLYDGSQSAVS